jgi:hypothetical protein
MQATAVTQATTVTPATSTIKDDSNIMNAHNSRKASNIRNKSNNRTANTVWTPPKPGMLAKTVQLASAWREANSSRDIRDITASKADGRPITTRMPEILETSQQHNMDANSTIWTPKTREFSRKLAISRQNGKKFVKKDVKRVKIPYFLSDRFQ